MNKNNNVDTSAMEAYEYVKNYLFKSSNNEIFFEQDYRFIGDKATMYTFKDKTYFSFTLNVDGNDITFCISEHNHLTKNTKFNDLPCYNFKVVNGLTDEDKKTLEKLTDRIKQMVYGLNNAVEKAILNIEEKFIIEHDTINFNDILK